MALGKRQQEQQEMWVANERVAQVARAPFYKRLNQLLAEVEFDRWAEQLCAPYYHAHIGRPGIPRASTFG